MLPPTDDVLPRKGMSGVAHPNRSEAEEGMLTCSPLRNSNKMKSLAEALQQEPGARIQEPEDSVSGTHRINPRKSFRRGMRNCRPSDSWILAPGSSCSTWHDWRY